MLELVRAKILARKKTRTRSSWTAPKYVLIVVMVHSVVLNSPTTQCCPGRAEYEDSISYPVCQNEGNHRSESSQMNGTGNWNSIRTVHKISLWPRRQSNLLYLKNCLVRQHASYCKWSQIHLAKRNRQWDCFDSLQATTYPLRRAKFADSEFALLWMTVDWWIGGNWIYLIYIERNKQLLLSSLRWYRLCCESCEERAWKDKRLCILTKNIIFF